MSLEESSKRKKKKEKTTNNVPLSASDSLMALST